MGLVERGAIDISSRVTFYAGFEMAWLLVSSILSRAVIENEDYPTPLLPGPSGTGSNRQPS